jgi:Double zinc ribbon
MAPLAVFGITNDGLNLAVNLLLLFLVVLWLALVYWTHADAKRRVADPMLVTCATVAALFPFVGTIVYMVVRPPEFLEDVHERELEIAAAETRLAAAQEHACPYCEFPVERSFLRCPSCLHRLKEPCGTCGKPLDPRWRICPYCEAEVPDAAPAPQRKRRRDRPAAVAESRPRDDPPRRGGKRQQAAPRAQDQPRGDVDKRPEVEPRPKPRRDRPVAAETAEARRERPATDGAEPRTQVERPSGPPARQ